MEPKSPLMTAADFAMAFILCAKCAILYNSSLVFSPGLEPRGLLLQNLL